eukprot:1190349-Prorocentrum_minimum.AAC.1
MEDLINNDAELLLAAVLNLEQRFFFVGIQVRRSAHIICPPPFHIIRTRRGGNVLVFLPGSRTRDWLAGELGAVGAVLQAPGGGGGEASDRI